ncbi:RICIN domain-containing protein [Streptomyces sp. NPDC021212]|uniref:RICIN domain-containing protein n=1 Tax=Streptomyces sp. NPDC021212 TaxID=3365118 RepID=UPI0037BD691C
MADPDSALRPRAGRKDEKESEEANKPDEANETKEITKATEPKATEPKATEPKATEGEKADEPEKSVGSEAASAATVTAAVRSSSAKASSDKATSEPAASPSAKRSDEQADADVGSLVATEGGDPPGSASKSDGGEGGDEPPSGRPTKALLAAAGIGGALLIAIPFLVAGTNSKDDSEPAGMARKASSHTMSANDQDEAPGVYAPKSPSDDESSAKPKDEDKAKAPESPAKPSPSAKEAQKEGKKSDPAPKKGKKASPKRALAPIDYSNSKNHVLKSVTTGKCADIPGYGKGKVDGPLQQFDCDGTDADNQVWNFEVRYKAQGPHSTNLFQIRNAKDGYCMDLPYYGSAGSGQKVTEFRCDGTTNDNQLWWLEKRGDKKFWIHNYASNQQCLAVKGDKGTGDPAASLAIEPCNADANHLWTW